MDSFQQLKQITGQVITVSLDQKEKIQGTGFLVGPSLFLTCAHCVLFQGKSFEKVGSRQVELNFPFWEEEKRKRRAVTIQVNSEQDYALLKLDIPAPNSLYFPSLQENVGKQQKWESYVFPNLIKNNGIRIHGKIEDYKSQFQGISHLQLSCEQAQDSLKGASGGAVIAGRKIIGMLTMQPQMKSMMLGEKPIYSTLYALPFHVLKKDLKQCNIKVGKEETKAKSFIQEIQKDLEKNKGFQNESAFYPHYDFLGVNISEKTIFALIEGDRDLPETGIIHLCEMFHRDVKSSLSKYDLQGVLMPRGLLGIIFSEECPLQLTKIIQKQTEISQHWKNGYASVPWVINLKTKEVYPHSNPVSWLPPVMILHSDVFPGIGYIEGFLRAFANL